MVHTPPPAFHCFHLQWPKWQDTTYTAGFGASAVISALSSHLFILNSIKHQGSPCSNSWAYLIGLWLTKLRYIYRDRSGKVSVCPRHATSPRGWPFLRERLNAIKNMFFIPSETLQTRGPHICLQDSNCKQMLGDPPGRWHGNTAEHGELSTPYVTSSSSNLAWEAVVTQPAWGTHTHPQSIFSTEAAFRSSIIFHSLYSVRKAAIWATFTLIYRDFVVVCTNISCSHQLHSGDRKKWMQTSTNRIHLKLSS